MKALFKCAILIICGIALTTSITIAEIDYSKLGEDIDIMARIIDKTLEEKYPDEYKAFKPLSWSGAWQGCQGFYLRDYGVIFVTKINMPMSQPRVSAEETGEHDLWEATKEELRRGQSANYTTTFHFKSTPVSREGYSAIKVEQLKQDLMEVLGKYGPNISNLAPQDNIVIAVQDTPGAVGIATVSNIFIPGITERVVIRDPESIAINEPIVVPVTAEDKKKVHGVTGVSLPDVAEGPGKTGESHVTIMKSGKDGKITTQTVESGKISTGTADYINVQTPARRTTLIVKAAKEDIGLYKSGELDMDNFVKKVEITQY